jgi:hypothetical protein
VEEGGPESWEDGVGEEIDVEDWQEEMRGVGNNGTNRFWFLLHP